MRGTHVLDVTALVADWARAHGAEIQGDALIAGLASGSLREHLDVARATAPVMQLDEVRLESPIALPARVIGVRANYPDSTAAPPGARSPEIFLKCPTSVAGPADGVPLRFPERRTDHEVELAVVIGRRADRVERRDAARCVAGYCIGLDMTLRGDEDRGLRKSLPGYTILGPWLTSIDELAGATDLQIDLERNGVPRQTGRTGDMRYAVDELVAHASTYFELLPGDVLLTGTPGGAGPVARGDLLLCRIERLGTMTVRVR